MKKFSFVLALAAVSAFGAEWTGYISDSKCGKAHADGSEKSMKCVNGCVKSGKAQPVFVVGDKVLKIDEGSASKVADHLGHKVTITGKLDGETVKVDSVAMAH